MPAETNVTKAGTNASRNIIINNTVYLIVEKDNDTTTCLAVLLNSIAARVFFSLFLQRPEEAGFLISHGAMDSYQFLKSLVISKMT
jgi:hypothetical protein